MTYLYSLKEFRLYIHLQGLGTRLHETWFSLIKARAMLTVECNPWLLRRAGQIMTT